MIALTIDQLKKQVICDKNITLHDNTYRYVDHNLKLATVGFMHIDGLIRNSDIILFSDNTVAIMRKRYSSMYIKNDDHSLIGNGSQDELS